MMMQALRKLGYLIMVMGFILFAYGGLTIMNHGVPREPLPLEGR
jgi:hypothetical protein